MSNRKVNWKVSRFQKKTKKELPVSRVELKMVDELYDLVAVKADALGIPMNEFIVQRLAASLDRNDLAAIPRKSLGRPRKNAAAVLQNG